MTEQEIIDSLCRAQSLKFPIFELNASIEKIFMENRDKNIFCLPATMKIPESMRDRS